MLGARLRRLFLIGIASALAACGEGEARRERPPSPAAIEAQPASGPEEDDAVEPRGSVPRELVLAPSFLPDPATLTGFAGGSTLAAELNPACLGWVRRAPNHR